MKKTILLVSALATLCSSCAPAIDSSPDDVESVSISSSLEDNNWWLGSYRLRENKLLDISYDYLTFELLEDGVIDFEWSVDGAKYRAPGAYEVKAIDSGELPDLSGRKARKSSLIDVIYFTINEPIGEFYFINTHMYRFSKDRKSITDSFFIWPCDISSDYTSHSCAPEPTGRVVVSFDRVD